MKKPKQTKADSRRRAQCICVVSVRARVPGHLRVLCVCMGVDTRADTPRARVGPVPTPRPHACICAWCSGPSPSGGRAVTVSVPGQGSWGAALLPWPLPPKRVPAGGSTGRPGACAPSSRRRGSGLSGSWPAAPTEVALAGTTGTLPSGCSTARARLTRGPEHSAGGTAGSALQLSLL